MKQQLKNKIKNGYMIELRNIIFNNDKYIGYEYIRIKENKILFKDVKGAFKEIKKEPHEVINNIIENTFYNINNFKMIFYRDYKISKKIILKFKSEL